MPSSVLQSRRHIPTGVVPDHEAALSTRVETIDYPSPDQLPSGGLDVAAAGEGGLAAFLADPLFAIWAVAAAKSYRTTPLHALELLASALMEDGATDGTVRAQSC